MFFACNSCIEVRRRWNKNQDHRRWLDSQMRFQPERATQNVSFNGEKPWRPRVQAQAESDEEACVCVCAVWPWEQLFASALLRARVANSAIWLIIHELLYQRCRQCGENLWNILLICASRGRNERVEPACVWQVGVELAEHMMPTTERVPTRCSPAIYESRLNPGIIISAAVLAALCTARVKFVNKWIC